MTDRAQGDIGELASLQYLRAVAAVMVVAFHAFGYADSSPQAIARSSFLLGGVDLFFVISGFVMWTSTANAGVSPLTFYRRRLARIAPLYWLLTTVLVVVMLARPELLRTASFDLAHVLASYGFLAWPHPTTGAMFPVLVPGWTLNYEMFFYLVFGALLVLPARARLPVLALAFGALVAARLLSPEAGPWLTFYADPIILEFVAGVGLGAAFLATRRGGALLPFVALVAGAALLVSLTAVAGDASRAVIYGLPAVMVVGGAAWLERARSPRVSPALKLLGDASYSIYLAHPIVLAVLSKLWSMLGMTGLAAQGAFFVLAVATAIVSGLALSVLVERPMLRAARRRRMATDGVSRSALRFG